MAAYHSRLSASSSFQRNGQLADGRVVAIVSPYFPPNTLAGVHRARHLAKHLPAVGWKPIIICVDPVHHEESLDPGLAALVPTGIEIVKVGAWPARLTRAIGVGDVSVRSWTFLRGALIRLLQERDVGVVFITGSPYYPMLFARDIMRRFRIPVILDFQDPWVSSWGRAQSSLSKAGLAHRLATALEPRALRGANFITSVSEAHNLEMLARYPWLDAKKMAAIEIGGDPDDFAVLGEMANIPGFPDDAADCLNLSYVGTFQPTSGALFRTLFRAFAILRAKEPQLAARIRLNFIGTSNQPNDTLTFRVLSIAEAEGVADIVRELPQRLPYLNALNYLVQSHGLLLIGSEEPHYTASKIYPALMSGTPFLSLFHRRSSAHSILASAGGGRAFAFDSGCDLASLEEPLATAMHDLACTPHSFGKADPAAYARYHAKAIAGQFGRIFDCVAAKRAG